LGDLFLDGRKLCERTGAKILAVGREHGERKRQTETVRSVFNRAEGRRLTCNFFNKRREVRFPATSKGERPDWRHRRQRRKERREQDQTLL
jgi:hypothetical protein